MPSSFLNTTRHRCVQKTLRFYFSPTEDLLLESKWLQALRRRKAPELDITEFNQSRQLYSNGMIRRLESWEEIDPKYHYTMELETIVRMLLLRGFGLDALQGHLDGMDVHIVEKQPDPSSLPPTLNGRILTTM